MKKFSLRITRRRIVVIALIWLLTMAGSLVVTALQLRGANLRELKSTFEKWPTPGSNQRIVVFAPHCDDETLAAAGLMRQATDNGAEVWVVLMTNGDGFRAAAAKGIKTFKVSPSAYIKCGYLRQTESFTALAMAGVPRNRIITLGYPDRGLEPMWVESWNTPHQSYFILDNSSPYSNSYTRRAPFTGKQLMSDLTSLLTEINPHCVYVPYPSDQHPDHWATSVFVAAAMYDLGWLNTRVMGLYMVHRGDWPVPQGLHPDIRLAPPAAFAKGDTTWYQYPLDPQTVKLKEEAIRLFRSQPPGTRRFLRSFVRQNELFATREPAVRFPTIKSAATDGKVDEWKNIEPVVTDALADGMLTQKRRSADVAALYAAQDSQRVYFRISTRGGLDKRTSYELRVHAVGDPKGTTSIVIRPRQAAPDGWEVAYGKKDIELSRPLNQWADKTLIVSSGTLLGWYQIDRTAYRFLIP